MRILYSKIFALIIFLCFAERSSAQNFLNGDFENNSGSCIVNGSNAQINANVSDVTAYGLGNEIDLMDNGCGYGTAYNGNYFLCLANSSGSSPDAITLTLDVPLVSGTTYTICYYDRGWDQFGCCPPGVPIEVGVSSSPTSQGTIVYTSPVPTNNTWSQRVFSFVAPVSGGQYISFQAQNNNTRWTHIDFIQMNACCAPSTLNFTVVNPTCGQSNGSVSVTPAGAIPPFLFSWNTPAGDTTQTVTGLAPGTYTVTVTDSLGCITIDSVTITNVNLLNLAVNPSAPTICFGDSVTLTASGGATYSWNPTAGLNTANDSVVIASPSSTTTYTLTGSVSACIDSITVTVTVQPLPLSTFSVVPASACQGEDVTITYTGGSSPLAIYNWNFDSGIITSGTGQGPYEVHWNTGATYTISLTVSENGCTSLVMQQPVTIYAPPDPSFIIAPQEICATKMVQVSYMGNASASAIYNWSFGTGSILQGSGEGPYVIQYNSAGQEVVMLTVTDHGCPSSQNDTLQVDPVPFASFVASDTIGCDSLFVQFTNLSAGATSYQWNFGDGTSDTASNPAKTYGIGSYTVWLIVTNSYGCKDTLTIPNYIRVYQTPMAQFSVNPAANVPLFLKDANFQFSNSSLNASDFWWDFGDSTFSAETDPSHQYTSTGNYTVTLFAYDGSCFDSVSLSFLMVDYNPSYFIPNAFSPNGDGINDFFNVLGFQIQSVQINIFNRWGELIFESSGIDQGWDGTYKGKSVEIGAYVYLVQIVYITGEKATATGDVILIR